MDLQYQMVRRQRSHIPLSQCPRFYFSKDKTVSAQMARVVIPLSQTPTPFSPPSHSRSFSEYVCKQGFDRTKRSLPWIDLAGVEGVFGKCALARELIRQFVSSDRIEEVVDVDPHPFKRLDQISFDPDSYASITDTFLHCVMVFGSSWTPTS